MNDDAKIKAVVFDLDGVYFENGTESFVNALKRNYGLGQNKIEEIYFYSDEIKKLKRGQISSADFWRFAVSQWGIDATRKELVEMMLAGYSIHEQTMAYVVKLREAGVKTAVCTNNFSDRLEGLKEKFGLGCHFDTIVSSHELGVTKPDSRIFHHLAGKLGLPPNRIVMSDDKQSNIVALRALGFEAFLYEGWDDFAKRVNCLLGGGVDHLSL